VVGVVGAASFVALANASKSLAETVATTETITTEEVDTLTTSNAATSSNQSSSSNRPSSSNRSSSSSSSSGCTVQCRKSCSYPGHCHDYVDTNDNGRCDLGECS
jgi:hypothetical protein